MRTYMVREDRGHTSCCDAEATFVEETLCCKGCYEEVEHN